MPLSDQRAVSLQIGLFGPFTVQVNGGPLPRLRSRKGQALLALLTLWHDREVERDWLAGLLWPDRPTSQALATLRRDLTDLRRALGPEAGRLRSPNPRTLCLDLAGAGVDVAAFDAAIACGDTGSLERAVARYRGPLLDGWTEEWVFQERQTREQAYLQALETLAAAATARGDAGTAERYLRQAVAADPLRETAQRALMQTLAAGGNYAAAILAYRDLGARLHREINAQPDAETRALFQRLRAEAREKTAACSRSGSHTTPVPPEPAIPADLPLDIPARRLREAAPHNLPLPLTRFIGREDQMAEIEQWLAAHRLVTLTGAGGCGKTRLAIEVAGMVREAYPEGVWLVELASLADPALVPQAVASVLGVRESPGHPLTETLAESIQPRQLLLVLDNCEHVVDACAHLVEALLCRCPGLRILATSREALASRGEVVYQVPPLSLPDAGRLPALAELTQYEAVRLFIERATAAQPAFRLTEANAGVVAESCRRLEGIPLAIELAAAHVRMLPVDQIAARLDDPFRLLTRGSRTALPRQQTLRAMIDWSYDLLPDKERTLLWRLSVFAGGWTLEAAEAIGAGCGIEAREVFDLLTSLGDKSLLQFGACEGSEDAGGAPREPDAGRYRLLEMVRQYARERLEAAGEGEAIRRQHAWYLLRLAEEAAPGMRSLACQKWLARLEAEHDNLRAALLWSHQEPTAGEIEQRLVAALSQFWGERSHWREGQQWLESALTRGRPDVRGPEDARPRSISSSETGLQALPSGEVAPGGHPERLATWAKLLLAAGRHEESLAIWRQLGDRYWLARALECLGKVAAGEEAVSLFREIGNQWELLHALYFLGNSAMAEGDYSRARPHYEESLALARQLGDPDWVSGPLAGMGHLAHALGDYRAARSYYEESIAIRREYGNAFLPYFLNHLGEVAYEQGDLTEAGQAFEEALAISRDCGRSSLPVGALVGLGRVAWRQGEVELARARGEEALKITEKEGNRQGIARALLLLGRVAQGQGDRDAARSLLRRSLSLCHELGERREVAERLEALAAVDRGEGQLTRAARLLGAAAALRDTCGPSLSPIDRADQEQAAAALRAALGADAWAAAWAAGQAMTLEDTIPYALQALAR